MRAFYLERKDANTFGFKVKGMPKRTEDEQLLSEDVVIDSVSPDGAMAIDGNLRAGDRIIKVNGQWILCLAHAEYLIEEMLGDAPALDITVARGEPLPPMIDIASLSDRQLEAAAFEHSGLRVLVHPKQGWSREQVVAALEARFAKAEGAPEPEPEVDPEPEAAPEVMPASKAIKSGLSTPERREARKHLRIQFSEENDQEFDTYTKQEYDRPLDPGEGMSSLRDLFGCVVWPD